MEKDGLVDDVMDLKVVIVYWLRYMGIFEDVKDRLWEYVRDDVGYVIMVMIDWYIEFDLCERYVLGCKKCVREVVEFLLFMVVD